MFQRTESRLLILAASFLTLCSAILTLSPAGREVSWQVDYRWSHWAGLAVWGVFVFLAHRALNRRLPDRDPLLFPAAALLSGWGLLTIWRLDTLFGLRQTIWLAVALLAMIAGFWLPEQLGFLRRYKYLWLSGGLALTALTLIFGTNPSGIGPRLWLGAGGVYLQPSEPLKLLLIIYLAAYFADHPAPRLRVFPFIFPTMIATGLALLILFVQRDLGTASIFILLYTVMLYLATGQRRVLLASAVLLAAGGIAGAYLFSHIQTRIDAWLNPWADPLGRSYQIIQSLLAVANGGLFGRGIGLGSPGLVPIAISDFIFVAIAEEAGLAGSLALLGLIGVLVARGLRAAFAAADSYRRLLAGGLAAYIGVQSLMIIGGDLRLVPLTGVTLPFVSYGGSSLLTSFLALLFLLRIGGEPDEEPAKLAQPRPYYILGGLFTAGLIAAALSNGWWGIARGPDLLTRADNARRSIADRYVRRGALFDREDRIIQETVGVSGSFERVYLYPALGPVSGYTSAAYGQSGLEAGLDPYLRGTAGNPAALIWWHHLLYGRPPEGLDIRLSLDLALQTTADQLLGDHTGAIVLLNAQSGEVLAMASHPGYDANLLDEQAAELFTDDSAPLFNRAAQGQYPAGNALGPFLYAAVLENQWLPALSEDSQIQIGTLVITCARNPEGEIDWAYTVANGCPGATLALIDRLGAEGTLRLIDSIGLYDAPGVPMPVAEASAAPVEFNTLRALTGGDGLRVSPLQMALAAASLSADGVRPAARVTLGIDTPQAGWVIPAIDSDPAQALASEAAEQTARLLRSRDLPIWGSLSRSGGSAPLTWYLAGTLPEWSGAPIAVAVVLEEDRPDLAEYIGQQLLQSALGTK